MTEPVQEIPFRTRAVAILALLAGLGVATYFAWPWIQLLSDTDEARRIIENAGAWAPVLFIAIQALQVIIAPIPGQATVVAGGYLFGAFAGLAYTLIGSTVGSLVVFVLTRKLGHPFVERFISKGALARFDELTRNKGALVFFFIFLFPALPDDVAAFVAGLTHIPISTLVAVSVAGRLPGYLILSIAGHGLTSADLMPTLILLVAVGLIFVTAFWKREWFRELAESDDRWPLISEAWSASWRTIAVVSVVAATAVVMLLETMG